MAGWEEELAMLLRELGVAQEEPRTHLQPTFRSDSGTPSVGDSQGPQNITLRPNRKPRRCQQPAEPVQWNDMAEDDEAWMNDLSLMRREVDAIVAQVIRLMQRGDLDKSLKEDVMVVLRALRRRASVTQQAAASEAAYLEFAAAMLHFCRLVLRLSEVAPEDM